MLSVFAFKKIVNIDVDSFVHINSQPGFDPGTKISLWFFAIRKF